MNKEQVVAFIAEQNEGTKVAAKEAIKNVDALVELIASGLEDGEKAKLGSYIIIERNFKEARNGEMTRVENGETVKIPYTVEAHSEVSLKKAEAIKKL